jgi:hypothetical protein
MAYTSHIFTKNLIFLHIRRTQTLYVPNSSVFHWNTDLYSLITFYITASINYWPTQLKSEYRLAMDWKVGSSKPGGTNFLFSMPAHTGPEAHLATSTVDTVALSRSKAVGT